MLCEKLVLFIILDQQVSFNYDFDLNYLQKSIFFWHKDISRMD